MEGHNDLESATVHLDADKVLASLGRCPPYQCLLIAVLSTVQVFAAGHSMLPALAANYHPYACVPNSQQQNVSNASVIYGTPCEASDDEPADDAPSDIQTCGASGTNYTLLFDPSFGDSMVSEFKMVCGRRYRSYLLFMASNAGAVVTVVVAAQLSDTFGRRPVFVLGYWCAIAAFIALVHMPSFALILALRFVIGSCMSCAELSAPVLMAEHSAPAHRALFVTGSVGVLWPVGYLLVGLAAMLLPQWRPMAAVIAYPFLAVAALCWIVPESLHWLVAQRRNEQALALTRKLERLNCATVDVAQCHKEHSDHGQVATAKPGRTLIDVVKSPMLSMHTLALCYIVFTMMMVYQGLSMISTRLSSDRFTGYFLSGIIEIPAGVTATFVTAKFSRKKVYACSVAVQVSGLVTSLFLHKDSAEWLRVGAYLVAKYGNICAWGPLYLVVIEIAPTTVRNVVRAVVTLVGFVGSMAAPWVAGAIADVNVKLPNAIFVALSLLSVLAMLALPETFNTELPEDMDDLQPGPVLGRWYKKKRPLPKGGTT